MDMLSVKEAAKKLIHFYAAHQLESIEPMLTQGALWLLEDSGVPVSAISVCEGIYQAVPFMICQEQYYAAAISDDVVCITGTVDAQVGAETAETRLSVAVTLKLSEGKWQAAYIYGPFQLEKNALQSAGDGNDLMDRIGTIVSGQQLSDTLTGILNLDGMERAIRQIRKTLPTQEYAFATFLVDNFDVINQAYGYTFGEMLLQDIANNLRATCGQMEVCGRVHSNTFAIFVKFSDKAALEERIRRDTEHLVSQELQEKILVKVTFSAGIYLMRPNSQQPVKEMLYRASMALQSREYTNSWDYFGPAIYNKQHNQDMILALAPLALENREFQMYIQPKVDLKTKKISAGEALVRWVQAGSSFVGPGEFIPVFEDSGMIEELDFYMLDLLCATIRQWMDLGVTPPPISVNQSQLHIGREGYVENICAIADKYRIPYEQISIELTESAFTEESVTMHQLAKRLHRLGFKLEIDDFGTGYTALNLISMLSADILKVDKSLVDGIEDPQNERSRKVLEKIIEMAHDTDMTVVCEGVENGEQLAVLEQMHCDTVQGYHFYRPMPAESFLQLLRLNR